MTVEVLYFDGCPNHEALLPRLRELLASGIPLRSFVFGDLLGSLADTGTVR